MPTDLPIRTTAQVAAAVGVTDSHVRRLSIRHDIGTKLSARVRVFTDADVTRLRALLHPGMGRKPH